MSEFKKGDYFDDLYKQGEKMGFAKGGQVKKMDSMDHGVQPARKGRNQQEVEAGGTPKLKPGFKKGGKAKKKMKGGHMKSKANKKMPKDVRKKGGLAHASKYKHGGPYKSEPMYGKD